MAKEYKKNISIKQWSEDDRPREKLAKQGSRILSNAELIAILIGSGNKTETAVELSKRILNSVDNNLNDLGKLTIQELEKFNGIGTAKAISIIAALELGKRRQSSELSKKIKIGNSNDAFEVLYPMLSDLPHEEFWIILLNQANKVIGTERVSIGGITGTVADIRIITKIALERLATGIIISHNHPSGNLSPSKQDLLITQKIKEACSFFDIHLLDHLILADQKFYSFSDHSKI